MEKRSKAERLTIAASLLSGIWREILEGQTDDVDVWGLLGIGINAQVDINRIMWWLNRQNNKHMGDTEPTDCAWK